MIIENSDISILEGYGKGGYGSSCILIWEDDVWGDRQMNEMNGLIPPCCFGNV